MLSRVRSIAALLALSTASACLPSLPPRSCFDDGDCASGEACLAGGRCAAGMHDARAESSDGGGAPEVSDSGPAPGPCGRLVFGSEKTLAADDAIARPRVRANRLGRWVVIWSAASALLTVRSNDLFRAWSSATIFEDGIGGAQGASDLAFLGDGEWLAVWSSTSDLAGLGSDPDLLVSKSRSDGGGWTPASWVDPAAVQDKGDDRTPAVAANQNDDVIALWSSNSDPIGKFGGDFEVLYSVSVDRGATWKPPAAIDPRVAMATSDDDCDPQIATDGRGFMVVWTSHQEVHYSFSPDTGVSWTNEWLVHPVNSELDEYPHVATGGGRWIVVWQSTESLEGRIGTDHDIMYAISSNDGEDWSPPRPLHEDAATDADREDRFPRIAYDPDGHWIAAWNRGGEIVASLSTDDGETWGEPVVALPGAPTESAEVRPDVEAKRGEVAVVWASDRRSPRELVLVPGTCGP